MKLWIKYTLRGAKYGAILLGFLSLVIIIMNDTIFIDNPVSKVCLWLFLTTITGAVFGALIGLGMYGQKDMFKRDDEK